MFASCGLYTYIFSLYPPISFDDKGSNLLELYHNLSNNDGADQEFLGYEIFYRAYDDPAIANDDAVLLNNAVDNYENNPDGFMNYTEGLGFLRLRKKTDSTDNPPLVIISDSSPELYYLELNSGSDWVISPDQSITSDDIVLVRSISLDYTTRRSFYTATNYRKGDADYEGESSPKTVFFVFFATAFGTDTTSFTNIYSLPKVIDSIIEYNLY